MSESRERDATPRRGLILAAGLGSRLEAVTGEVRRKPLLEVGGKPLIVRVLEGLDRVGCSEVVVVVGFMAEELQRGVEASYRGQAKLRFVPNPDYQRSNGLSVWAAREYLTEPFILSMSDHLLSPKILELAKAHRPLAGGATLLIDRKIDSVFDLDDATKVVTKDGKVVSIGKQLTTYDCIDTGVFVCTAGLVEAIDRVRTQRGDASLSDGVQALAAAGRMEVLDVGDASWMDVDTPEMLADAERRLSELG